MLKPAAILQDLIAIPSVNPLLRQAGDAPDSSLYGEARVAEYLLHLAKREGLEVERRPVFPGRENILVRLAPAGKPRRRVAFAPHMDTVGATPELLKPRLSGGRIYGRGACDTKGSVAAMFAALGALARDGRRPRETEVILAALVDEEVGQSGSRALMRERWKADLAIVGEPTCLKVVTAHKGLLIFKIFTKGKAAHGSRPELGINAIHEMMRVVDVVRTEYVAALERRRHPVLGPGTINIGAMRGGRQPNIVPDACQCILDRRLIPGETPAKAMRELARMLAEKGVQAQLRRDQESPCPPLYTDHRAPLVAGLMEAARQPAPEGVTYFSDGGVFSAGGVPSVLFGPGDIAQAHTVNEWVSVSQLNRARDILLRFLRTLP